MVGRLVLIAAILVGVTSGRPASAPRGRDGEMGCGGLEPALAAASPSSPVSRGRGLAALLRDRLVMVAPTGEGQRFRLPGRPGLPRHAASQPGIGTAFVNDVAGSDSLMVMRPTGVTTIEGRGELTHPAWSPSGDLAWAVDLSVLEVWSPATGARRLVPPPRGAAGIFSPVFTAPERMLAVVQMPAGDTHDDTLNDLWGYDLDAGTWSRITHFEAEADRWSVLRTPVVTPRGTVLFVRVAGRASATEPPSFELWALRGGRSGKLRDLPGERYLAGMLGHRLVWNVPDPATGDWRLVSEGPRGAKNLGCGAVSVDPVAGPDPDLLDAPGKGESAAARAPGTEDHPGKADEGLAIVIGDFSSRSEARAVAEALRDPGAHVVNHRGAPAAVRPGAWAVAVPIPDRAIPEEALAGFRARHPNLADRTWIVPFERRGMGG